MCDTVAAAVVVAAIEIVGAPVACLPCGVAKRVEDVPAQPRSTLSIARDVFIHGDSAFRGSSIGIC